MSSLLASVSLKAGFFVFVFFATALLMHRQAFTDMHRVTTIKAHVALAKALDENRPVYLPHKGFFEAVVHVTKWTGLDYRYSAILILSFMATLTAVVTYNILGTSAPGLSGGLRLLITLVLMTVAAIYLPVHNKSVYFGQGSPNIWHNATGISAKPFVVSSFFLLISILRKKRLIVSAKWVAVALLASSTALISVYIKPSYMLVLVPALVVYFILKSLSAMIASSGWATLRHLIAMSATAFIILLPACWLVWLQYMDYGSGADARKTTFELLLVWKMFSPNVLVSILITIALPLFVLICRFKSILNNDFLAIAWLTTIVGMAQFALLAEVALDGAVVDFTRSGNWIGGYLVGLSLLFVFTVVEMLDWIKKHPPRGIGGPLGTAIALGLLTAHFFSGICYLVDLASDGKPYLEWHD